MFFKMFWIIFTSPLSFPTTNFDSLLLIFSLPKWQAHSSSSPFFSFTWVTKSSFHGTWGRTQCRNAHLLHRMSQQHYWGSRRNNLNLSSVKYWPNYIKEFGWEHLGAFLIKFCLSDIVGLLLIWANFLRNLHEDHSSFDSS